MAIPRNRSAVQGILADISDRIIGQKRSGFSCSCGAISCGPATAVGIQPGGDSYPGQEKHISCWSVMMRYHPEDPNNRDGYYHCISEFIPYPELEQIFSWHFFGIEQIENPWRLVTSGYERILKKLPPAVRIRNNANVIEFVCDWGMVQETAKQFIDRSVVENNTAEGKSFFRILEILRGVNATPYRGGPIPELEYESEWLVDLDTALKIAQDSQRVIVGSEIQINSHGAFVTSTSFLFSK